MFRLGIGDVGTSFGYDCAHIIIVSFHSVRLDHNLIGIDS